MSYLAFHLALQSGIGRAETTSSDPNAGVFARPDSEVTSTTVTVTTTDSSAGTTGTTGTTQNQFPWGEIK